MTPPSRRSAGSRILWSTEPRSHFRGWKEGFVWIFPFWVCMCVSMRVCVCALGWCHSFQPSLRLYLNMNRRNPSVLVYSQIKQTCFNPVLVLSFWIKLVVFCDSLFLFSSFCFVQIRHIYLIKEIILHLWKIRTPWELFLYGGWQRH